MIDIFRVSCFLLYYCKLANCDAKNWKMRLPLSFAVAALCSWKHVVQPFRSVSMPARKSVYRSCQTCLLMNAENNRAEFILDLSTSIFLMALATPISLAQADEVPSPTLTGNSNLQIRPCSTSDKASNCVSTASVKNLDKYSPPWEFQCTPDEAFARLKGVIVSDQDLSVVEVDEDARYIKAKASRNNGLASDELDFVVRGNGDNVVVFRSEEIKGPGISDFGAIRAKLESLRKKGGVFETMGGGLTADSYDVPLNNRGAFGQLKAFYGLQSGKGFESVFEDDED
jgi:uncharacterized protein (DUF1499 family)